MIKRTDGRTGDEVMGVTEPKEEKKEKFLHTGGTDGPTEGSTRGPRGPKKLQHKFPKMRGRGRRQFGIFPKIYPIWYSHPSIKSIKIARKISPQTKSNAIVTCCLKVFNLTLREDWEWA